MQRALAEARTIHVSDNSNMFVILGANITSSATAYAEYNATKEPDYLAFFDVLDKFDGRLHPQVLFTLARLCGYPKVQYYASITPPEHSRAVLGTFQQRCVSYLEKTLDFKIPTEMLHSRYGMGMPDYVTNAHRLYNASFAFATRQCPVQQPVSLVTDLPEGNFAGSTAYQAAQASAQWLFYNTTSPETILRPQEFQLAMAIRCGTVTSNIMTVINTRGVTCGCNERARTAQDLIDHALVCRHNPYCPTKRHTEVKNSVAACLRRHDFHISVEPTNYIHLYNNGKQQRPDIAVYGNMTIATDFVISQQHDKPGDAAHAAAAKKNDTHKEAVSKAGDLFIPYSLEAHGYAHSCCETFSKAITETRTPLDARDIRRELAHVVSIALARARVRAVLGLVNDEFDNLDQFSRPDFRHRHGTGGDTYNMAA